MCIGYKKGKRLIIYRLTDDQLKAKPIYKSFQGWKSSTVGIKFLMICPKKQVLY